jgi:DNA-binding NarL/FixJ family response regulator
MKERMPVSSIFIVDEFPAHIEGVAQALVQVGDIDVIGTATSGAELLASLEEKRPDVVLIEPWMRSGDGLDAMAHISRTEPGIAMIALSRMWDDDHVARAFEVGASGFMRKDAGTTDLASLIGYVQRGGMVRPAIKAAYPEQVVIEKKVPAGATLT